MMDYIRRAEREGADDGRATRLSCTTRTASRAARRAGSTTQEVGWT